jgi:membrane protease YdiL (CAAX protease family)
MLLKALAGAVPVIALLIAAAFVVPADFPLLPRQIILCAIGVGGIAIAEWLLFGPGWGRVVAAIGFVRPNARAIAVALLVSLPMWLFLPVYAALSGTPAGVRVEWLAILIGVILVNGIAEEVIHRAFVFGHLRRALAFVAAATISAAVFGAQHLYLLATMGVVPGIASVALAVLLAYPLALMFERGGNSIGAPAILHTSSNAPIMLFALPPEMLTQVLLPHMAVVLVSIYLSFAFTRWLPPLVVTPRAVR